MIEKNHDMLGETAVTIDGVKHIFKHCHACQTANEFMDRYIELRRLVDKVERIANELWVELDEPLSEHCPPFPPHPAAVCMKKLERIRQCLREVKQ